MLQALRDHIKKLGAAARSNDDVANTVRMFKAMEEKLEAMVEPNALSTRLTARVLRRSRVASL